MQLRIDPEFKDIIPPLTDEEYKQLEENVKSEGCRDALVVWNGIIIDGHNRYKICQENDIKFKTTEKQFEERNMVREWIIRNQFGRRNLSHMQKCELALKLKPAIQKKAKENKQMSGGAVPLKSAKPVDTRNELAKMAGVSGDTMSKAEKILSSGTPEQIERARKGGKGNTVNAVYKEVVARPAPTPQEKTRLCTQCNQELHIANFYKDRKVCRVCANNNQATYRLKSFSERVNGTKENIGFPEIKMTKEEMAEGIRELYDVNRVIEVSIEDPVKEMQATFEILYLSLERIYAQYKKLIAIPENNKKIMAVLSEAETAIENLKGKYSYE